MFSSSVIPKIRVPPVVFAKALTLLSQLFTFLCSTACFLSYSVASPRNDADFLISAREIVIDKEMNESDEDYGSLIGANPVFLQNEKLELDSYQFCMQIYGEDFPEEFQDIFCLDDAIGYLFLSKEEKADDVGVFFVQCT